MKTTVEDIKKIIATLSEDTIENKSFGLRMDECKYKVGDYANVSHELYQDPIFDLDGELVYEEGKGIYSGYYDAGELAGTCVIEFDPNDETGIEEALKRACVYCNDNLHVVCGRSLGEGNDCDEIIIENAEIIAVFEDEE